MEVRSRESRTGKPQLVITGDAPPTISLTSPANGANFTSPAVISLAATATDVDGQVSRVEFCQTSSGAAAKLIASVDAAARVGNQFSAEWSNVGPGSYTISAVAIDDQGARTISTSAGVTVTGGDSTPPNVTGTFPTDQSVVVDARAKVIASYADLDSGIDVARINLSIDGTDVTSAANILSTGLQYVSPTDWTPGVHRVNLTVFDLAGNNMVANWSFSYDPPPVITGFSPADQARVQDARQVINVTYSDIGLGMDISRSRFTVDGADLTAQTQSTSAYLQYVPQADWSVQTHAINIVVFDLAGNSVTQSWSFIFDPPPDIYDEAPRDVIMATLVPRVTVLLGDRGNGIDLTRTKIFVDSLDVTASASISATLVSWLPIAPLSEADHLIRVETASSTGVATFKEWHFEVQLPPVADPAAKDGVRAPRSVNPTIRVTP